MSAATLPELVAEGERVGRAAGRAGLALQIMGGVAVALRCPSAHAPPLRRDYGDIDVAGRRRDATRITALLESLGYAADREFNALQSAHRMLFRDRSRERQLDVFLDVFEMCHRIDLAARLDAGSLTLAPADLLLCKLQVVETNHKDLLDVAALFCDHPLTPGSDDGIDADYLARVTAGDWGLWRTSTMVLERAEDFLLAQPGLPEAAAATSRALRQRLLDEPKTRGWRMRARIGERKRWYALPEEKG